MASTVSGIKSKESTVKRLAVALLFIVCLVLIGSWWTSVYESPANVFWGMLANNLEASGATIHATQSDNSASLDEYIQFKLGPSNLAQARVTINEGETSVKTQTISTASTDYTRYTNITINSRTGAYKNLLNIWANSAKGQTDPLNHLLGQTVLGVVPFANLPVATGQSLINQAQSTKVYIPDLNNVTRAKVAGQSVYVYKVAIQPKAYANFIEQVSYDEGLGYSHQLNPSAYSATATPLMVELSIKPASRQLLKIDYGNGHSEIVTAYGVQPAIVVPKHYIPISQLEARLAGIKP